MRLSAGLWSSLAQLLACHSGRPVRLSRTSPSFLLKNAANTNSSATRRARPRRSTAFAAWASSTSSSSLQSCTLRSLANRPPTSAAPSRCTAELARRPAAAAFCFGSSISASAGSSTVSTGRSADSRAP
eukprot:3549326-Rhodomonas_salina.1